MVLAMFVDAGYAHLLTALAGGNLFITPSIIEPAVTPPFDSPPSAEFAQGAFFFQEQQGHPLATVRFNRRTAFYLDIHRLWEPIELSIKELVLQEVLTRSNSEHDVQARGSSRRSVKIGRGEAECAAVAIARGWTLWSDDAAIVNLLSVRYPGHPVERISDLVIRAAQDGLLGCQEAADLYNDIFKATLGLWTRLTLVCRNGRVVVR
jgi:hypothetical protein